MTPEVVYFTAVALHVFSPKCLEKPQKFHLFYTRCLFDALQRVDY